MLDAIYAAYGSGWDDVAGSDPRRAGLAQEAVWLARTLVKLLPDEPEARGLLALMLYCEARRPARRTADGDYVPMSEQDVRLWSAPMIDEAEQELMTAAAQQRPGRFQLEAALQSAHVEGARRGQHDWRGIAVLVRGPGAGLADGWRVCRPRRGDRRSRESRGGTSGARRHRRAAAKCYQPYWAVRAHLLHRAGRTSEALDAFDRASGLTEDAATRQFLLRRRAEAGAIMCTFL